MITIRGISDHIAGMQTALTLIRAGTTSNFPPCSRERDRCVRRWLLVAGGYWPGGTPSNVESNSDAKAAVKALQRDLGVAVDGIWGPLTQAALDRALALVGARVADITVPPSGWPPGGGSTPPGVVEGGGGGGGGGSQTSASKVGMVMASLGILTVVGAAITAWVLKRRRK